MDTNFFLTCLDISLSFSSLQVPIIFGVNNIFDTKWKRGRVFDPKHPHVSTAKLIANRKK